MIVKRLNKDFSLLDDTLIAHKGIYGYSNKLKMKVEPNTYESCKIAIDNNIPFECDIRNTLDNVPVLAHDNTLAVIASVLIVGVIVFLLDLCFEKINTFGVEKLKTIVQSSQNEEADQNTVDNSNTESNAENTNSTAEGSNEESETVSEDTSSEENTDNSDNAE